MRSWLLEKPLSRGATAAHYASLVLAFPLLLFITRTQWFFYDEWDFVAGRGFAGQPLNLFAPHNEHWVTIPILLFRGLFSVFALHTYLPYLAVLFVAHIAVAHLLWRLMRRSGVDPWVSTMLALAFLFLGAGAEDLTWAFQITFVGSLAFGLLAALIADGRALTRRRLLAVSLALICSLMFSGVGITMTALVGLITLFKRGPLPAVHAIVAPAALYLIWFLVVGRSGIGSIPIAPEALTQLPAYVWQGITFSTDRLIGLVGAGAIFSVGIGAWLLLQRREVRIRAIPFATAIAAVLFFALTGTVRLKLGVSEAATQRYAYIALAMLLPSIGWILSSAFARSRMLHLTALAVLLICAFDQALMLSEIATQNALDKTQSMGQIVAAAKMLASGTPVIGSRPDPMWAPDLTNTELLSLNAAGDLPSGVQISDVDRFSAIAALETSQTSSPLLPTGLSRISSTDAGVARSAASSCEVLHPNGISVVHFSMSGPTSIKLTSAQDQLALFYLQQGQLTSNAWRLNFKAGAPTYLNVAVPGVTPYFVWRDVDITVCP